MSSLPKSSVRVSSSRACNPRLQRRSLTGKGDSFVLWSIATDAYRMSFGFDLSELLGSMGISLFPHGSLPTDCRLAGRDQVHIFNLEYIVHWVMNIMDIISCDSFQDESLSAYRNDDRRRPEIYNSDRLNLSISSNMSNIKLDAKHGIYEMKWKRI